MPPEANAANAAAIDSGATESVPMTFDGLSDGVRGAVRLGFGRVHAEVARRPP